MLNHDCFFRKSPSGDIILVDLKFNIKMVQPNTRISTLSTKFKQIQEVKSFIFHFVTTGNRIYMYATRGSCESVSFTLSKEDSFYCPC